MTQDSRVFFNHHVPNAPPYQNIWDIREAYVQLGSSSEGWFDLVAGRQMFSFGDERVIGPSDWSNMGVRSTLSGSISIHPGIKVSIFAARSFSPSDGVDRSPSSKATIFMESIAVSRILIPHATLEPYVLWRVAPGNVRLPETRASAISVRSREARGSPARYAPVSITTSK